MFVPAPNVLMVELRGVSLGVKFENTLYFRVNEGLMTNEAILLEAFLRTVFLPALKAPLSNTTAFQEIYMTDLSSQTAPTYSYALAPALYGGVATAALPNNVAMCVSFKTAGRGKWTRGRNYVVGIPEAEVTANDLSGTFTTAILTAYNKLRTDPGVPTNQEWVVISRYLDKQPRGSALINAVTAAVNSGSRVDSMRRRLG